MSRGQRLVLSLDDVLMQSTQDGMGALFADGSEVGVDEGLVE